MRLPHFLERRDKVTRSDLYTKAGRNRYNMRMILTSEYSKFIKEEAIRLLGCIPDRFIEKVIDGMMTRIPDIDMDCDLQMFAYDSLRTNAIQTLRQYPGLLSNVQSPALKECCAANESESIHDGERFRLALSRMTARERIYFFNRYYFFEIEASADHKYESRLIRLFEKYSVTNALTGLEHLEPQLLSSLTSLNADSDFEVRGEISLMKSVANREARKMRNFLVYGLPVVLIIFLTFTVWFFTFGSF